MTDQSLEVSCGLRWRHNTSDQVQFVGDLDTQLKLTVEVIRQGQRVPFVRFEHPARPTLHVHDVDGDVQLLQVLLQGTMIVTRPLHEHENLFQRSQAACPLRNGVEVERRNFVVTVLAIFVGDFASLGEGVAGYFHSFSFV